MNLMALGETSDQNLEVREMVKLNTFPILDVRKSQQGGRRSEGSIEAMFYTVQAQRFTKGIETYL